MALKKVISVSPPLLSVAQMGTLLEFSGRTHSHIQVYFDNGSNFIQVFSATDKDGQEFADYKKLSRVLSMDNVLVPDESIVINKLEARVVLNGAYDIWRGDHYPDLAEGTIPEILYLKFEHHPGFIIRVHHDYVKSKKHAFNAENIRECVGFVRLLEREFPPIPFANIHASEIDKVLYKYSETPSARLGGLVSSLAATFDYVRVISANSDNDQTIWGKAALKLGGKNVACFLRVYEFFVENPEIKTFAEFQEKFQHSSVEGDKKTLFCIYKFIQSKQGLLDRFQEFCESGAAPDRAKEIASHLNLYRKDEASVVKDAVHEILESVLKFELKKKESAQRIDHAQKKAKHYIDQIRVPNEAVRHISQSAPSARASQECDWLFELMKHNDTVFEKKLSGYMAIAIKQGGAPALILVANFYDADQKLGPETVEPLSRIVEERMRAQAPPPRAQSIPAPWREKESSPDFEVKGKKGARFQGFIVGRLNDKPAALLATLEANGYAPQVLSEAYTFYLEYCKGDMRGAAALMKSLYSAHSAGFVMNENKIAGIATVNWNPEDSAFHFSTSFFLPDFQNQGMFHQVNRALAQPVLWQHFTSYLYNLWLYVPYSIYLARTLFLSNISSPPKPNPKFLVSFYTRTPNEIVFATFKKHAWLEGNNLEDTITDFARFDKFTRQYGLPGVAEGNGVDIRGLGKNSLDWKVCPEAQRVEGTEEGEVVLQMGKSNLLLEGLSLILPSSVKLRLQNYPRVSLVGTLLTFVTFAAGIFAVRRRAPEIVGKVKRRFFQ